MSAFFKNMGYWSILTIDWQHNNTGIVAKIKVMFFSSRLDNKHKLDISKQLAKIDTQVLVVKEKIHKRPFESPNYFHFREHC